MTSYKYIIKRIEQYFQNISKDSHNKIVGDKSFPFIQTEPDFIYDVLITIKNREVNFNIKKFLDVGSGIGNMCGIAAHLGFISEGIELNPILYEISKQIYPEIKFYNANINDFNNYGDYDIIFYCVPFSDDELQKQLKEKIENSAKIGSYIITRGTEEKDTRFICIDDIKYKKHIWFKSKQYL